MPAIYAHHAFGKKVYRQMPDSLKETVRKYKKEYIAGLQGPDFLFFYNPLLNNQYGRLGQRIHQERASVFLDRAVKILKITGTDSPEGSYIMGFICHFMLDSSCHGFIKQMTEETGESHTEQETEFDRYMLERDGKDALRYPLYRLIDDSQELAETMSVFYKGVSTYAVRVSQERMRKIRRLLYCPNRLKRNSTVRLLRLVLGADKEYISFIMRTHPNPACEDISRELESRLDQAAPECAREIQDFVKAVDQGNRLSERFYRNFS